MTAAAEQQRYDLSPKDAAALVGVHEDTIKRWASSGKVPAFRTPGGWWRFCEADLLALLPGGES